MNTHPTTKIVVVGNGMVSYKFCERLRAHENSANFEIVVFGEEPRPAYDRVHLSEYFTNQSDDHLTMAPVSWYEENNIKLHLGDLVTEIDRTNKTVKSYKGITEEYDKLVLATGSAAFVPPINGVENGGVFVYRTIEDLDNIMDFARKCKSGAVIGGGLLGLEAAKALLDLNLETHVVEFATRLMPRQLDDQGAANLTEKIESLGVKVHTSKNTTLISGQDKVEQMQFSDGTAIDVDMVVISAGISPRDELAKECGLEVGTRGGVVVNNHMQTGDTDIYAIGEAALHDGMIYGLVAPGYEMADVVISHINDEDKQFTGFDMSTKLKLIGVDVASFGDAFGATDGSQSIVYEDKLKGVYKRINISEDGSYLLGGQLIGDAGDYNILLQMVNNKMKIPENPESLILPNTGDSGGVAVGVDALPDEALVCSCENVTKGDICSAIKENELENFSDIKACTKAGSGCGGCVPMVKDLLTDTLKKSGKVVQKVICEHFQHSRDELFDIIKITGITSYDELLDQHGHGDGCEVCKPAVASLLASIWGKPILEQDTIQDSNDRFLANIQRGGTYSVVPRVPAGEITAEKLIVLGEVAKEFDLYCKITGGQRIDLFGAQLHELPAIWEKLVDAGFESGHAYGKALRTVKSCVGSTWCRYGVQDSVKFAIEVEERYKGIRAPHKIKSAVSGCVRECAEAQCKDFGIIATEKGWNLYVGGNGGAKPRHGDLLASDIDSDTVLKYVDRFLMFYMRTADPLTRTSTWLDKLEGGIDYLKEVVIEDKLGLCELLESDMQKLVDSYECEWANAIKDPEKRKRFQHFINDETGDKTLEFVNERGQKVPAPW